jgi:predicted AlkP superfamily pyrophosphatase or phosphodiesterase
MPSSERRCKWWLASWWLASVARCACVAGNGITLGRVKKIFAAVTVVALLLGATFSVTARQSARVDQGTVVVISLDGFPAKALADPALPIPTLRQLAANGALAGGMTVVNPSVTWPSHTSMVTGVSPARHSVLFNGMLTRPGPRVPVKVEPWRDKKEMVQAPTVYDLAHQAGLTTAQIDWVAIQNPGTINWAFPERPSADGAIEREMVSAGIVTKGEIDGFARTNITRRDQIWTSAAVHIIKTHKPRLLLLHLLTLDSVHHSYGPGSLAASSAIGFLDSQVARVLEALDAAGLRQRGTVIVVSDHGFKVAPRVVRPNVLLRQAGLLEGTGDAVACDAYVLSEGGTAMVYVTNRSRVAELRPRLKALFGGVEGITEVRDRADFPRLGMPDPDKNLQMADMVLVAAEGYGFGVENVGAPVDTLANAGTGRHGYPNTDPDMNGIFIASGNGIKAGARLDQIANVDVAATIASLLGLKMDNIEGRRPDAILTR